MSLNGLNIVLVHSFSLSFPLAQLGLTLSHHNQMTFAHNCVFIWNVQLFEFHFINWNNKEIGRGFVAEPLTKKCIDIENEWTKHNEF